MATMSTCFRLFALKFIHKTPSFPPLSSPLLNHCRFPRKFIFRAFSATMSPPSTAVVYEVHGPPDEVTKIIELPPVEIKENDVCVKMLAAPINPSDINRIQGVYPVRPELPAVGGYEGVGEVHSLGSAVTDLSPGDWVIPFPPCSGTWQTYMVKEQSVWHKVDKSTPVEYAASMTINPLSALRMLEDFVDLKPGDAVVQNGATSIVGQCLIQLARMRGVQSINITRDRLRSDEARELLKKLGADEALTESQIDEKKIKQLQAAYPEVALGLNCVGGNSASLVRKLLRQGGTMVTYGGMSKKPVTISTSSFIFKEHSFKGFWLQKLWTADKVHECKSQIDYLLGLAREGKLAYKTQFVTEPFAIFGPFHVALDKSLGKLGSQPKQILKFE